MDPIHLIWLFSVGTLVGGAIIGAILYRNLAPTRKETANLKQELEQAQQEMVSYKASVDDHFNKTSGLVNQLTQDYVKVYQHLAEGAQSLGNSQDFGNRLEQHQGKVLISMDDETAVNDTIVSDQPATEQAEETPRDFTPQQDEETLPEESPAQDSDPDLTARETPSADTPEELPETNQEPVIDPEALTPNPEESDATVKATEPKEPTLLH